MRNEQADTEGLKHTPVGERGRPSLKINRLNLYKRGPMGIQATCWVRMFDLIDVQFRLVNGPDGVFMVGPSGEHRGPDGRKKFFRRFTFVDEELKERVEAMVISAYRAELVIAGRNEPPATPGEYAETDEPEQF